MSPGISFLDPPIRECYPGIPARASIQNSPITGLYLHIGTYSVNVPTMTTGLNGILISDNSLSGGLSTVSATLWRGCGWTRSTDSRRIEFDLSWLDASGNVAQWHSASESVEPGEIRLSHPAWRSFEQSGGSLLGISALFVLGSLTQLDRQCRCRQPSSCSAPVSSRWSVLAPEDYETFAGLRCRREVRSHCRGLGTLFMGVPSLVFYGELVDASVLFSSLPLNSFPVEDRNTSIYSTRREQGSIRTKMWSG